MTIIVPKDADELAEILALIEASDHHDKRVATVTDTPYMGLDVPESLARAVGLLPPLDGDGGQAPDGPGADETTPAEASGEGTPAESGQGAESAPADDAAEASGDDAPAESGQGAEDAPAEQPADEPEPADDDTDDAPAESEQAAEGAESADDERRAPKVTSPTARRRAAAQAAAAGNRKDAS